MASAEFLAGAAPAFKQGLNVTGTEVWTAPSFAAPSTAAASAALIVNSAANPPTLALTLAQTAPTLAASGTVIQAYATAGTGGGNAGSVVVARPSVSSASQSYPQGSIGGFNGVPPQPIGGAGTVTINCPSITATSVVKVWLVGLPALAVAAAATAPVVAPTIAITPGTNFVITGTIGAVYGWEVCFA